MIGKTIKVSAPGKIHLLGEHAVVYGKPALLTAIDRRYRVELVPQKDNSISITSKTLNSTIQIIEREIIAKTISAQRTWERFHKTNDVALLKSLTENPLDYPIIAIGEALLAYKKPLSGGFRVSIDSDIPVGAGLGSSAATAVSLVAAVTLFLGQPIDHEIVNDISYRAEQKRHGMPSGGDNAAVCFGGLLWFRKESSDLKIIKPLTYKIPNEIAKNFIIIDTGNPEESTGEMVSSVRSYYQRNQNKAEKLFNDQEKLTQELLSALIHNHSEAINTIIREGEKNLEKLGVVSDYVKTFIRSIEKIGGAAKICGGGGKTKGTGVVLAYHEQKERVTKLAQTYKLPFFEIKVGEEGLRYE